ncbi:prepilin-type cleavage/methylation domain-containing protein [Pseudomonas sp. SWI6]|uniref:Prepilin-type N-terminal cleavage/methylation domain-containing protein n=1 Tax=Pseudomonas taiwanensis TaxID=470150 RepID=A0ABR6V8T8_9PSED|nr:MULTISPECIES: prepilin-type N-terminal cleavage/methylation domain-containing protein [Pseudomonas]AGZ37172.1 hypothetical protein PVLB_21965 [Pseudomonas sp. VLB120]AVD81506.1 prepilin-type cleavage/methylation domain-containing protein [Pseudomonas sp. SWI6]AVD88460.1 prepilin-type cleavage/methylation domain-containing protein [Pseudomonas sp. SWI44]MBC3476590.1 prepilin-type N-terminal cleavage/methylation domain-containing protein [Pseudomonas taiwanensis]MBC3490649.1 prepilin-type N-t
MSREQGGFGLLEVMLALAIGLMCLAAVSQVFVAAHQAWRLQGAAVHMQDDARFALLHMAQSIRMAGMFGCLRAQPGDFKAPEAIQAFAQPLQVGTSSLDLVVAELPGYTGIPNWTLRTDCIEQVQVHRAREGNDQLPLAFPISRHSYRLEGTTLVFKRANSRNFQPLVNHVRELRLVHVPALGGGRVDIQLALYEPTLGIEQRYALTVAVRNPVDES